MRRFVSEHVVMIQGLGFLQPLLARTFWNHPFYYMCDLSCRVEEASRIQLCSLISNSFISHLNLFVRVKGQMEALGKKRFSNWPLLCSEVFSCVCALVMYNSLGPHGLSLPGSSIHGISQAGILEWVAISSSPGLSWPKDQIHISRITDLNSLPLSHLRLRR